MNVLGLFGLFFDFGFFLILIIWNILLLLLYIILFFSYLLLLIYFLQLLMIFILPCEEKEILIKLSKSFIYSPLSCVIFVILGSFNSSVYYLHDKRGVVDIFRRLLFWITPWLIEIIVDFDAGIVYQIVLLIIGSVDLSDSRPHSFWARCYIRHWKSVREVYHYVLNDIVHIDGQMMSKGY